MMLKKEIKKKINKNLKNEDLLFIGSGDKGEAYVFSDKVIKITKDLNEYFYASRLKGKDSDKNVNIYNTFEYEDLFFIVMEKIETPESIEDMFNELYNAYTYFNDINTILDIDLDDIEEQDIYLSDQAKKLLSDLNLSAIVYQKIGIPEYALDIQPDNIGLKNNGKYVFFDQRNMFLNDEMLKSKIKEDKKLKNKL